MSSSSEQTMTLKEDGVKTNEELYKKFTDLVSSWPCSSVALTRHQLYHHENGWYSPLAPMVSMMVAEVCFAARPSDVVVATIPKAGTTWMKAILYSTVHRRTHPAGGSDHPLNSLSPHECIKFLEYQLYTHNRTPDLSKLPDPRLFATHAPYMSLPRSIVAMGCKLVYVCRDPTDALISQWSFVNKARVRDGLEALSIEVAADFFCHGVSLFGPYWDHVIGYWGAHLAHPKKVLFFRYEEMTQDPATHVRKLAEFLGRPFNMEEEEAGVVEGIVRLCSFNHMTRLDATKYGKTKVVFGEVDNSWFFRRGQVGDWENHLSSEMAQRIDAITEARFKDVGLRV